MARPRPAAQALGQDRQDCSPPGPAETEHRRQPGRLAPAGVRLFFKTEKEGVSPSTFAPPRLFRLRGLGLELRTFRPRASVSLKT